jgi:hypothetical protein
MKSRFSFQTFRRTVGLGRKPFAPQVRLNGGARRVVRMDFSAGESSNQRALGYLGMLGLLVAGAAVSKIEFTERNKLPGEINPHPFLSRIEINSLMDKDQIIVAYGGIILNLTSFLKDHPGGEAVLRKVNGYDIREVWNDSSLDFHLSSEAVQALITEYKIGDLPLGIKLPLADPNEIIDRNMRLRESLYRVFDAFNAEPHELFFDPKTGETKVFYIRDHSHEHEKGSMLDPDRLILLGIKNQFADIVCAGAGRSNFTKKTEGTQWGQSSDAIGTMQVHSVPLRNVLEDLQLKAPDRPFLVRVVGDDGYSTVLHSSELDRASIAVSTASKPMLEEHGAPVRLIVKGAPGFMQIKWVKKVSYMPLLSEEVLAASLIKQLGDPLKTLPEKHRQMLAVCKPMHAYLIRDETGKIQGFRSTFPLSSWVDKAEKKDGKIHVSGIAYAGDTEVSQVEVLVDGKEKVKAQIKVPLNGSNHFVFWYAVLNSNGKVVSARAEDNAGDKQPKNPVPNKRGLYFHSAEASKLVEESAEATSCL